MQQNEIYRAGLVAGVELITRVLSSYKPSQHLSCTPDVCSSCRIVKLLIDSMAEDRHDLTQAWATHGDDLVDIDVGWLDNGNKIGEE